MIKKSYLWYRMAVLTYYRTEWTDVSDEDQYYRLKLTVELDELIRQCRKDRMNIPNAAYQVRIFIQTTAESW